MITIPRATVITISILLIAWVWYVQWHIDRLEKYLKRNNEIMINMLTQLAAVFKSMNKELDNMKVESEDDDDDDGYLDVGHNSKT
jgi:hypothetical protein